MSTLLLVAMYGKHLLEIGGGHLNKKRMNAFVHKMHMFSCSTQSKLELIGHLPYGPWPAAVTLNDNNVMVIEGVNVYPPCILQSIIISCVCIVDHIYILIKQSHQ